MRFKIGCILVGIAFGALSVAGAQETSSYDRRKDQRLDPEPREAHTLTRYIGLLDKAGACPPAPGSDWTVQNLVDMAVREVQRDPGCGAPWQPGPEDRALIRDLGLDRFCVYTSDKPRYDEKGPFGKLPGGLVAAKPDRMALSASAPNVPNALEKAVWQPLADTFKVETEGLEKAAEEGPAFKMRGDPTVRLAILDSQEDQDGVPLTPPPFGSQHGYTLMHLAQRLTCPDSGRCAAKIASRRALGYANFGGRFEPSKPLGQFLAPSGQGGEIGTVSELGNAIVKEILRWRHDGSPGHLILNLSLGWDGELFKDLDVSSVAKMDPAVRYVYNALRFAARRGVLVVAAAGNQKPGSPSHWPILPAAWEVRRPSWCPLLHRHRLIYAVGGVEWQGLPLPNSRDGGRPQRVAYGGHAVVDRGDGRPTAIYTGTSVSAAVVSSLAAVVWHLRPELRRDQVMRLIDLSGEQHPVMQADFYPWKTIWPLNALIPAPQLSQVTLCRAVDRACADRSRCPALAAAPGLDACRPLLRKEPNVKGRISASSTSLPSNGDLGTSMTSPVEDQRWTLPQPAAVPCSGCSLDPPTTASVQIIASLAPLQESPAPPGPSYTLHLQISDDWLHIPDGAVLQPKATLNIGCFDGSVYKTQPPYEIPFALRSDIVQAFEDIGEGKSLKGCTAQLTFFVKKSDGTQKSIQNPVVVDP